MRITYTLMQIVEGMSEERRKALARIIVAWEAGEANATLVFRNLTHQIGEPLQYDEHVAISTDEPIEQQIQALYDSHLVGDIDASRYDGGAQAVQAGHAPIRWHIVPWYKRKPGRPKVYTEHRSQAHVSLPDSIIQEIDMRCQSSDESRSAYIERVLREHLGL